MDILGGIVILFGTGLIVGVAIALVVKYYGVAANPLLEKINELMPGANCGGCGYAGCSAYAQAMAENKARPGNCPSMSPETVKLICGLTGATEDEHVPMTAVVLCSGGCDKATQLAQYNGVNNCRDAAMVEGGAKACAYGCLGLGACAQVCPFGAIEINENHLAVVHSDLCRACGKCVKTCPKHLIKLVPKSTPLMVFCSSPERGAAKLKACKAACIGCGKCVKNAQEGQMTLDKGLASVNIDNPPSADLAAVCPTKALRALQSSQKDAE